MKYAIKTVTLLSLLLSLPGYADQGNHRGQHRFVDRARVIEVTPIIEVVQIPNERSECWQEEVSHQRPRHAGPGMILGGVIGGVLGSQMGHGSGNKVATVAGTLIGAAVGSDLSRGQHHGRYTTSEQRCRIITDYREEEQTTGYRVTYRYQGQTFTRVMDYDPGRFVRVAVRVEPIDG